MPTNRAVATFQVTAGDLNVCCNGATEEESDLVYLASKLLGFVLTDQLLARYTFLLQNSILWKAGNSFASCKIQSLQVGTGATGASASKYHTPLPKSLSLYLLNVKTSCSLQAEFQSLEVQDQIALSDGATRVAEEAWHCAASPQTSPA